MKMLLGGCLQAVGILIAGLTGLCSLIMLTTISSINDLLAGLGVIAALSVPLAIGVGLIVAGRAVVKSARDEQQ